MAALGRYGGQPYSEVVAMPSRFRRMVLQELKRLIAVENGEGDE